MALSLLGLCAAYLLGAIPVGVLVARAAGGVDIRRHGSGSIGATNVARTLGTLAGVVTLAGDVAKGYVAATVAAALGPGPFSAAGGAVAAVAGNCWSVFLVFRGGKGVATGLGAFLALAPWALVPAAALWLGLAAAFRYVSLASVMACAALPVGAALVGYPRPVIAAAAAAAGIIVLRHRDNLRRLRSGTERRLGERVTPT